ncbi:unnamed protein product [Amoebophrya sp. A25]|nr:unnamed protein product [Amoebophrya sp. A25]|eukprot:GSA25T00007781001.1
MSTFEPPKVFRTTPGVSNHAATFMRQKAFEGYVYSVREREIMPKGSGNINHYERSVGMVDRISKDRFLACAAPAHAAKLAEEPTLTPKQQEEVSKQMKEPLYKFTWVDAFNDPNFIVPGNNKTSYKAQWQYKTPEDLKPKPDLSKFATKPQFYPKNMLEMNLPRVKLYGIDPVHYENPIKFELKNDYGAGRSPRRQGTRASAKWHSEESWNDPFVRSTYKITGKPIPKEQRSNNLPPL